MKVTIPGYDEPITVRFEKYESNGRLAVALMLADGRPFATLSCNLPEQNIGPDEFAVKVWSENEELAKACQHLFIDTGRTVPAGYCDAPVWRRRFEPKIVVVRTIRPVEGGFSQRNMAIFDTKKDAKRWIERQMVNHGTTFTLEEVPYKP